MTSEVDGLDWMAEIKAVGWDLDGTLYPPDALPTEAVDAVKLEDVKDVNGWDDKRAREEYAAVYKRLGSHTKTLTELGVDGVNFFVRLWDKLDLEKYIQTDERLVRMVREVGQEYRQFVLSNSNTTAQIERKLRLIGFDPEEDFEFLVSTVEVGAVKPDPEPFLTALKQLELEPYEVLYVGDRERTDVMGARGVGMRSCLVWGESVAADVSLPRVYGVVDLLTQ